MADWKVWLVVAAAMAMLEMFTGTLYLLMIAIGCAVGGLAAWMGASTMISLLVSGGIAIVAMYTLSRSKLVKVHKKTDAAHDPNINLDIGQALSIKQWDTSEGVAKARVMHRGAMWDVELAPGATALPGLFTILEVRGSHFIVSNTVSSHP
ncbi:MAG: NfeD family protein [Pseudomonadota bacterium]